MCSANNNISFLTSAAAAAFSENKLDYFVSYTGSRSLGKILKPPPHYEV